MARSRTDDLYSPDWPLREPVKPEGPPAGIPKELRPYPSSRGPKNPFPEPKIEPPQKPINIWRGFQAPAFPDLRPEWLVPAIPPPATSPFPDPSTPRLPPIPSEKIERRDLNPLDFPGQGRNEPGDAYGTVLRNMMPRGQVQSPADSIFAANGTPEYHSNSNESPQGGLLGRLIALQEEQNQYRSNPQYGGQAASAASTPLPQDATQSEADQAQQAREAAGARLVRGVRSLARSEGPPPDPIDIAKSAGIGFVNGVVNTAGLPANVLTGFGHFPNNFVANQSRRWKGFPELPADEPDHFKPWTSDELRRWLEGKWGGEFYRPKSRVGRFAETVGEMVPMILGGEGARVRRGVQSAGEAMRGLPGILAKHAVAPGVAVQTLEEAYPDSPAGEALQKAYPVLRRVLPAALAAKRHFGN